MRSKFKAAARVVATFAMGLALSSPALAQDFPAPFSGLMQSETNRMLMDNLRNRNLGLLDSPRPGGPSTPRGGTQASRLMATPSTASVSTRYRASPEVSARVRKQFSDYMAKQAGAEGGRKIATAMERTDPVQNWARLVASDGLRTGDAADALAGYWVLNWMIANRGDNTRAQTLAVREQVRPIIASNPGYARLNEAQRQEFAEVLMLNFLVQQTAYTDALQRRDESTARRLGDAAVARFRSEMGVDLRQITLTDNGFVRRR
jgi:hypothetical protein